MSDVDRLRGTHYINDNIMAFSFKRMDHLQRAKFVNPWTTYVIMHETDQEDLINAIRGSGITPESYMLFPVCDKDIHSVDGGTHGPYSCSTQR